MQIVLKLWMDCMTHSNGDKSWFTYNVAVKLNENLCLTVIFMFILHDDSI